MGKSREELRQDNKVRIPDNNSKLVTPAKVRDGIDAVLDWDKFDGLITDETWDNIRITYQIKTNTNFKDTITKFPDNPITGDTSTLLKINNKGDYEVSVVYEYNGTEWSIRYNFNYNYIVKFNHHQFVSIRTVDDFASMIDGANDASCIDNFKRDEKTNTIYANIIDGVSDKLRPPLYEAMRYIKLSPSEYIVEGLYFENGYEFDDTFIVKDFPDLGYIDIYIYDHEYENKYPESIIIENTPILNSVNVEVSIDILIDTLKVINAGGGYDEWGNESLLNLSAHGRINNIIITNDTMCNVASIVYDGQYYDDNGESLTHNVQSIDLENVNLNYLNVYNADFSNVQILNLPSFKSTNYDPNIYILLSNINFTQEVFDIIISHIISNGEVLNGAGYIYFSSNNINPTEVQINQLQALGYTVFI